MYFIPFIRKQYTSVLSSDKILVNVKNKTMSPNWRLDIGELINCKNQLEGKVTKDQFVLGSGKYSLTYGKINFYPITKATIKYNNLTGKTTIIARVRLSWVAILILTFFYLIATFGILIGLRKNLTQAYVICTLFFLTFYPVLIFVFNIWQKKHLLFIKENLLG